MRCETDENAVGTAVEALPLMRNILSQRPTSFRSVEGAIDWQ